MRPSFSSTSSGVRKPVASSPSLARRRALKEADEVHQIRVGHVQHLSDYLTAAKQLEGHFHQSYENLDLDAAYVYGMRFCQLGVQEFPKHSEWIVGGPVDEELKPRIEKVLSRLEIIKRKMDEEESRRLRTRMLARAEEEESHRKAQKERLERLRSDNTSNIDIEVRLDSGSSGSNEKSKATKKKLGSFTRKTLKACGVSSTKTESLIANTVGARKKLGRLIRTTTEKTKDAIVPKKATPATNDSFEEEEAEEPYAMTIVLPSLDGIRQYRAQQDVPRYTIETKPVSTNEVKLSLYSAQTPSFLDLQQEQQEIETSRDGKPLCLPNSLLHPASTFSREPRSRAVAGPEKQGHPKMPWQVETEEGPSIDCSSVSPPSVVSQEIKNKECAEVVPIVDPIWQKPSNEPKTNGSMENLLDSSSRRDDQSLYSHSQSLEWSVFQNSKQGNVSPLPLRLTHSEHVLNGYQVVIEELKEKLSAMYTGHHTVVENPPREQDSVVSVYTTEEEEVHAASSRTNEVREKSKAEKTEDTEKDWNNVDCLIDTFDIFDAYISKNAQESSIMEWDEESYMEVTVIEEEDKDNGEEDETYLEYIVEEDEESYMEYTVAENNETKTTTVDCATRSPSCVASDRIVSTCKTPQWRVPRPTPNIECPDRKDIQRIPLSSIAVSRTNYQDDEVTLITMDECFQQVNTSAQDPVPEDTKQIIKTILYKDLWRNDAVDVELAMIELHDIMVQQGPSMKVYITEFGEIMTILMKRNMVSYPNNEAIQFLCCTILGLLALDPKHKATIEEMGVVRLISESISNHRRSQRIQDAARDTIRTVISQ